MANKFNQNDATFVQQPIVLNMPMMKAAYNSPQARQVRAEAAKRNQQELQAVDNSLRHPKAVSNSTQTKLRNKDANEQQKKQSTTPEQQIRQDYPTPAPVKSFLDSGPLMFMPGVGTGLAIGEAALDIGEHGLNQANGLQAGLSLLPVAKPLSTATQNFAKGFNEYRLSRAMNDAVTDFKGFETPSVIPKQQTKLTLQPQAKPAMSVSSRIGSSTSELSNISVIDLLMANARRNVPYVYDPNRIIPNRWQRFFGDWQLESPLFKLPLRSKTPEIDAYAKKFYSSRADVKNYYQSKQYRRKLRKAGIPENYITQLNNNIDATPITIAQSSKPRAPLGLADNQEIRINIDDMPRPTDLIANDGVRHEFVHAGNQLGTPTKESNLGSFGITFSDNPMDNVQFAIHQHNKKVVSKYRDKIKDYIEKHPNWERDVKYFTDPREVSANLTTLLIRLKKAGANPNQAFRRYNGLGWFDNDYKRYYDIFGEDGVTDLMTNVLQNGGRIRHNS